MASNNRASLLSGLRTGGVRTPSNSAHVLPNAPYTAATGGQFPRYASSGASDFAVPYDQMVEMAHGLSLNQPRTHNMPATASVYDGQYQQQQAAQQAFFMQAQAMQRMMGANVGLTPDQQVLQLQMDYLKLQQQQQLQAQMLAQAHIQQIQQQQQVQQQQQPQGRRRPSEPATAGPLSTFPASVLARNRNLNVSNSEPHAMTASIDGRFPSNPTTGVIPPSAASTASNWRSVSAATPSVPANPPATPGFTTVISGGTPLGSGSPVPHTPPKHENATSWRRASITPSTLRKQTPSPPRSLLSPSPPTVFISTPEDEEVGEIIKPIRSNSPPGGNIQPKARPQPLHFNLPASQLEGSATLEGTEQVLTFAGSDDEESSTPTPTTGSSAGSAREEASKRLYEGLGIGRPAPQVSVPMTAPLPAISQSLNVAPSAVRQVSAVSQAIRQPRGPPSGVEDLGARNFASRIRRKAIGGLGALMDARGKRDISGVEIQAC